MAHRMKPDRRDPRRRRRNRAFGVAALLAAALFTAPLVRAGGSGSEADELDTKEMTPAQKLRGEIVPDAASSIRFSHAKHDDAGCGRCHADVGSSESASDNLIPEMRVCADCHAADERSPRSAGDGDAGAKLGPAPALRNCSGCHVGYDRSVDHPVEKPEDWRAVEPPPMMPARPESRLPFDHSQHLERLGGADDGDACSRCHGDPTDEPSIPTLSTCQECHERTGGDLKPTNHTVDWIERHGSVARASSSCEDCHTEDECADCHDEEVSAPFSVHPPNFDTLHAVDARANLDDCAECHTIQTFCRRCHAETKFAPSEPDRPPPKFDMHPPTWTEPNAPNNHAVMARRNIEDCASCHTERDCVSCHRGVNPHPPEFRLKCKNWLESNPAPCKKCHGNLSEIRQKCL